MGNSTLSSASQSISNQRAKRLARPWRSTSAHQALAVSAAMWLGTMSRISPKPALASADESTRNPSSPPSSGLTRVASIAS
jgi:hypothetical protein